MTKKQEKYLRENMDKIAYDTAKDFFQELEDRRSLIFNYNYVNWLYNFMLKHPCFCDDDWDYKQNEISEEDYSNVKLLSKFVLAVHEILCDLKGVCAETFIAEGKVKLRIKDKYFLFQTVVGQGSYTSVEVVDVDTDDSAIQFENIVNKAKEIGQISEIQSEEGSWIECPQYVVALLRDIEKEMCRIYWNQHQKEYNSPFGNYGNRFESECFSVKSYDWNGNYGWNFKCEDIEVSWYKYLGRGDMINGNYSPLDIVAMYDKCMAWLRDRENIDLFGE